MFDIGATELLLIAIVAVIVIGPKDMPLAMRTAGRWIGKMRKLSAHFRSGIDTMVREAELEDMEKKWKAQNEKIMREHPQGNPGEMEPTGAYPPKPIAGASAESAAAASAEAPAEKAASAADENAPRNAPDDAGATSAKPAAPEAKA